MRRGLRVAAFNCVLGLVICCIAPVFAETTNSVNREADADFLMVQMRYGEAAEAYSKIDQLTEEVKLKTGIAQYFSGEFSSTLKTLEPLSASTNSATRTESRFYGLSSKLAISDQEGRLFEDTAYARLVLTELNTEESKAFRELLLSQLLEHLLSSQGLYTPSALLGTTELVEEQLGFLDQEDPRTRMLWVKFGYLKQDHDLVNKKAAALLASEVEIEADPFLYSVHRYLSKSLYAMGRVEKVFMEGSGYASECSTRADTALYYGVEYLRLRPDDEEFADWLSGKVMMSLFLQTRNPGYLVDILEVGHPTGEQLDGIHRLAKGVLRYGERKKTFGKADEVLASSMFSSRYWNTRGRIELMGHDSLLNAEALDDSVIQSILTQNGGRVPILVGGAMLMRSNQDFLNKKLLLHNKTSSGLFHHTSLSRKLFGQDMAVVHKFIDANKSGGSLHRMFSGHDLLWLKNNLVAMASLPLKDGSKVGATKASQVWLQHIGQDFFSIKGIPTPITKPVYVGAERYAKIVLGKPAFGAKKYATKIAAQTCLNATKALNVAMWGWMAYEAYDAYQDFAAEKDVANAEKGVQLALFYGDLGSRCDKLERQLSSERSKERTSAKNLSLNITLARLYAMNNDPEASLNKLSEVVEDCRDMGWELENGVDLDKDSDIEDRAEDLDKLSRKIKEVLIHDATFNAQVSCEGYAHEALLLVVADEGKQKSYLGDALGAYERIGDKLLEKSKDGAKADRAWSAAVNYYRAARLAHSFKDGRTERLVDKAVGMLFEMRKESGVLTRPLVDKLRRDWLLEFGLFEQAENMEDVRVFSEPIPKQLKWYELHIRKLTLDSSLLTKRRDIIIELVRKNSDIETILLRERLDDVCPDKPFVFLKRLPIGIASDDEYELRMLGPRVGVNKTTFWDKKLYLSNDFKPHFNKGLQSLVSAFSGNTKLTIEADLIPATPLLFGASALKLSDQAGSIAEEKKGLAIISMAGREAIHLASCPVGATGKLSLSGINLEESKTQLAVTGFPSVLLYLPVDTSLDAEIRQLAPWTQGKWLDLVVAGTWPSVWSWVAAEHLTYGRATDMITSFSVSETLLGQYSDEEYVYSIDGSALMFSTETVMPISGLND